MISRSDALAFAGAAPADVWVPRTKLLPVRNDDDVVIDDQLFGAAMEATRRSTLTLVRAQGGSGKTTLAAAVAAAEADRPVAWIRLDAEDDAVSLLHLLDDALESVVPGGCPVFAELLRADLPASYDVRRTVGALVNDLLAAGAPPVLLVLDDLHLVSDDESLAVLRYLLENAPEGLRFLATARSTPALGVSRLRATGRLTEITAADLRLTPEQAGRVLNDRLGMALTPEQLAEVVGAADGWVTGVRLLAGSDRRPDQAGSEALYEYLVEEILDQEPLEARQVLFETCVLETVTPSLARQLSGRPNAGVLLEGVQRRNAFLVRRVGADGFGYHTLFASFLRAQVERATPGGVAELHERTATALAGTPAEIDHLIAAGRADAAAAVLDAQVRRDLPTGLDLVRTASRVDRLGPAASAGYPWLRLVSGVAALQRGDRAIAMPVLEETLAEMDRAGDEVGQWMVARHLHHATYDNERFVPFFARIEASPRFDELPVVARVEHLVSSAYGVLAGGDWDGVARRVQQAIRLTRSSGLRAAAESLAMHLSPLLAVAPGTVDRIGAYAAESAATYRDNPLIRLGAGSQQAYVALLRCQPGPAREAALRVDELIEGLGGLPYQRHTQDWVLAIAALADGDLAGAERWAAAPWAGAGTEEAWTARSWPRLALLARIDRLRGGSVKDVWRRWEGRDRDSDFIPQHTALVEHSVRAQVAWAAGDLTLAEERLRAGVEVQERNRLLPFVTDLRLDLALVVHAAGRGGTAELERFLAAAEAYNATGLLLTAGREALPLLRLARSRGVRREVVAGALTVLDTDHRPEAITVPGTQQTLSSREVEVLRLIASGASNAEIAESLVISPNTVKTHVRRVLAKAGAANRAQAVVAARRLGIG